MALALQAQTGYKLVARYPIPGNGGFDYVTMDEAARRVYFSHGTQVDVIDADSGKVTGTIANTQACMESPSPRLSSTASPAMERRTRF